MLEYIEKSLSSHNINGEGFPGSGDLKTVTNPVEETAGQLPIAGMEYVN
jgi:hypothetical protein